jgi:mannose-6-phosphate isomerase-like protein (cupin superfamily)
MTAGPGAGSRWTPWPEFRYMLRMDELDQGLAIAVTGRVKRDALAECRRQLAAWGLRVPRVPPLVLDFGLGRFRETGLIEYWIANEARAGYCGKYLFVFDGQTCPLHRHGVKHETFFIVKGAVQMKTGGRVRVLRAGAALLKDPREPYPVHCLW